MTILLAAFAARPHRAPGALPGARAALHRPAVDPGEPGYGRPAA